MVSLEKLSRQSPMFAALSLEEQVALRDGLYMLARVVVDEAVKRNAARKVSESEREGEDESPD